jgi:ABC-type polar amino acid transport system ATPase subunit
MPVELAVQALGVHKFYGAQHVLRGMDLEVRRGQVVVILGSSGSGKSTFLRCLNHLETIERGGIRVCGDLVGYRETPRGLVDPEMISEVLDVMVALSRQGMTMIVVTHEMGFARAVADRVVCMDEGRVVEDAIPAEFFSRPRTERGRAFLDKILH